MLGHGVRNRAALHRYRRGQSLADQRDTLERAAILLQIHHNLRRVFSLNPELAYGWMRQANRVFHGKSPVQLISQHGMMGLYIVRAYLAKQLS